MLLIREQLPARYRGVISSVLGDDLQFSFYQKFYDVIFLTSAVLSIFLLYAHHTQTAGDTKLAGQMEHTSFKHHATTTTHAFAGKNNKPSAD